MDILRSVNDTCYEGKLFVMKRENGYTPNGNKLDGRWVLRNRKGEWIDFDKYRNELAERNGLQLGEK